MADIRGQKKTVGEWALHVQCAWRLSRPDSILLARGDIYCGAVDDAIYNWENGTESRFDKIVAVLNQQFKDAPPRVSGVYADAFSGFSIRFDGGYIFEVFPDDSRGKGETEHWRLFKPSSGEEHFVFP